MKGRSGLGRGLAALLPVAEGAFRTVDIDLLSPNPRQPRQYMDPDQLAELSESIREHGVLQPIVVTTVKAALDDGGAVAYQIIAGERRWQAARIAGLERVPVIVKEATEEQTLAWALVENIQRADLGPLEEAAALRHLVDDFSLTQEQVAERVGRTRVSVANTLRLLNLPDEVKGLIAAGKLTEGHGRALLQAADDRAILTLARKAVAEGWSVRRTEEEVRRDVPVPAAGKKDDAGPEWRALENRLRDSLGTKVELARSRRGGKVVIHFYSDDELNGLLSRLGALD